MKNQYEEKLIYVLFKIDIKKIKLTSSIVN